jgi:hypothetical protein
VAESGIKPTFREYLSFPPSMMKPTNSEDERIQIRVALQG